MNSFTIEDGKITREIGSYEPVYLREDVLWLIRQWSDYFENKRKNAEKDSQEDFECKGALEALWIIKDELK